MNDGHPTNLTRDDLRLELLEEYSRLDDTRSFEAFLVDAIAELRAEADKLVKHFREVDVYEGNRGDLDNATPAETAIRVMLERKEAAEKANILLGAAHTKLMEVRNERDAEAHVIIEHGVIPGAPEGSCRCEECRSVAKSMAEAGYLDRVTDKWWESPSEGSDRP